MCLFGVPMALPRHLLGGGERFLGFNEWVVWYSGMLLMLGLGLAAADLFLLFKHKRSPRLGVRHDPIADARLVVALTEDDDEASIADAVRDFQSHSLVDEVIVSATAARATQLSTFMYCGNVLVGKLLKAKHFGRSTITDAGTTYKLCRREALIPLMVHLEPAVNLEFNADFLDTALDHGYDIVERPITFHPRVGVSKGGNLGNRRALRVGLRMVLGIVWGWRAIQA
jgi:hypothetical protein